LKESSETYISNQIRPNSRVNLFIYNTFNTKNGRYKTKKIRNVGEPPHLLDSAMVDLSANQIRRFLFSKGYFKAKVEPTISVSKKRAHIDFKVDEGVPYQVRNIDRKFEDEDIKAIFEREVLPKTAVKSNTQYDAAKLLDEREKLYISMRNNGYYDYVRQYMRAGVDSTIDGPLIDLKINVENPSDSTIHKKYQIMEQCRRRSLVVYKILQNVFYLLMKQIVSGGNLWNAICIYAQVSTIPCGRKISPMTDCMR